MSGSLIDHLQEQGYEPNFDHVDNYRQDWYDLVVSGIGTVRAVIYPADGYSAEVHLFDGYTLQEWQATFSPGAPNEAIIAVLEAAERELAGKRGGPVTPAQEQRAEPYCDHDAPAVVDGVCECGNVIAAPDDIACGQADET